jgi:hypothetical protein
MGSTLKTFIVLAAVAVNSLIASPALSASIEKINKKLKTALINEGKQDGIAKGKTICFFNSSGKKVTCGKVVRVLPKKAAVKVQTKFQALQVGMEARAPGAGGGGGGGSKPAGKAAVVRKGKKMNVKGLYVFTPLTPAAYTKLSYLVPAEGETAPRSLWEEAGTSTISFLGFGSEFEYYLSPTFSIAAGFRYRMYNEFTAQADYTAVPGSQYVETNQTATAIGIYSDAYYYTIPMGSLALKFGNGLDIDMSTQEFNAGQLDDTAGAATKNLASYTTKASVISLRNLAMFDFPLGSFGMTGGLNFLLPLVASTSASGNVDILNAEATAVGLNGEEDLKAGINHTKASFGLEVIFSAYFAF